MILPITKQQYDNLQQSLELGYGISISMVDERTQTYLRGCAVKTTFNALRRAANAVRFEATIQPGGVDPTPITQATEVLSQLYSC